jgi:hypothetical protein
MERYIDLAKANFDRCETKALSTGIEDFFEKQYRCVSGEPAGLSAVVSASKFQFRNMCSLPKATCDDPVYYS